MKTSNYLYFGLAAVLTAASSMASPLNVCDRTPAVRDVILKTINAGTTGDATPKTCEQISDADLASLKRVAVPRKKIEEFKVGDFSGLTNLEILNIMGNPFKTLAPGVLADLPNLKTLVIFRVGLTELPEDFLQGLDNLENLHVFGNPFTSVPERVFQRFAEMKHLKVIDFNAKVSQADKDRLAQIFPASSHVELNFF